MAPPAAQALCAHTGVKVSEWLRAGAAADDAEIVREVAVGVSDDSLCTRGSFLCAPHAGALAELAQADAKLRAGVEAGWCTASDELPCWPLRSSPYSVVDESLRAGKPKFRLTTDLSWPVRSWRHESGDLVDSVNAASDRSSWPVNPLVRVSQFAEAAAILAGPPAAARPVQLWSLDCEAFYRLVGRRQDEVWRNVAFAPDGMVVVDQRCCFGDASAATKCARISNVLAQHVREALAEFDAGHPTVDAEWAAWQAARRARAQSDQLHWCGVYVDDGLGCSADDLLFSQAGEAVCRGGVQLRRSARHFEVARAAIERFGWRSAPSKEVRPAAVIDALGMCVDLRKWRMYLGAAKAPRYAAKRFAELLGRLQFAAQCWPDGAEVLRPCWRAARAHVRTGSGAVPVTVAVARALTTFAEHLDKDDAEGVPLACSSPASGSGDGACVVYADASSSVGYAAWTVRGDELRVLCGEWSECEKLLDIATLELLASTWGPVALLEEGEHGARPALLSYTDNVVVAKAIRVGWSEDPVRDAVLARRARWLRAGGWREAVARITSANNLWADWGSRGELGRVVAAARAAGLRVVHVPVPDEWRAVADIHAEPGVPAERRFEGARARGRQRRGAAGG